MKKARGQPLHCPNGHFPNGVVGIEYVFGYGTQDVFRQRAVLERPLPSVLMGDLEP
jgi:hypothetical protein